MSKYDVLVVGAGPAGMFACYELLRTRKRRKIALIDTGNRIEKRKPNEVMCGVGGAGTFSDGKLHFTAKLSHEKAFHLIDAHEYQEILDYVDTIFTKYGVNTEYFPKESPQLDELVKEATIHDLDLIIRKTRHVGSDGLHDVMLKFQNDLLEKEVEILDNTQVVDLIVREKEVKGVITKNGTKIYAPKVLLAPGRVGATWLQKIAEKYGIKYLCDKVEVGVRVEFPAPIMKRQADTLYEVVYKVRTKTYHDIVRTFCSCPNGFVAKEMYDGYICVNGYSNADHNSKNSNFALLSEVRLTEPVENSVAYAKSIAEVTSTIGGGKPILQSLEDFRYGRRSTLSRLSKSFVYPSFKDVTPGDISMALPYRIVQNLKEALEKLDEVMPGINNGSTLLYAPEVKFRSSVVATDNDLQTSVKGLYVAGDGAGVSGSVTGAAVTGIMFARGI